MPELKPVSTTASTLGIVFGVVMILLAAAGAFLMPNPGSAGLVTSPTPASNPTQPVASISSPSASTVVASPATTEPAPLTTATPQSTATVPPAAVATVTPTPGPTIYVVQSGDTLSEIAEKFGVSADEILGANELGSGDALVEGQQLVIPLPPMSAPTPAPSSAEAATPTPISPVYVVQSGDVLGGIAERFGVSVEAIKQANGLTDADALVEGQQLTIPAPSAASPSASAASQPATTYVVKDGDTLVAIAFKFGVSVEELSRVNGLSDADAISLGQNLIIP